MLAVVYAPQAMGWGFRRYPKSTGLVILQLVLAVLFEPRSFGHFFPQCQVTVYGHVYC